MKIGSELLQTVADKLNMEQVPGVQSWRQLAHQLGIPHDAYREFDRTEPRKSPTTEILQWLTAQYPDITLIDVVKALDKVQRNDAIQIITEQFPDTVGKYKCHKLGFALLFSIKRRLRMGPLELCICRCQTSGALEIPNGLCVHQ